MGVVMRFPSCKYYVGEDDVRVEYLLLEQV